MPTRIESQDNSRLKLVRKLRNKKARDEYGRFVIEGYNLVEEALNRNVPMDFMLVADDFHADKLIEQCADNRHCDVFEVPAQLFNRLSDAEYGCGILAVVNKEVFSVEDADISEDTNILVLDRVQDPGNIGTMIRTAVAAGYGMVVAVKGTGDVYSPKVLRATAGMIFDIPIVYVKDAGEMMEFVSGLGKKLVVTTPVGGVPYYEEDLSEGVALVIGNEGQGISEEIIEAADIRVTIPMKGEIESLNAAVSAAVLMYEAVRK